MPQCKMSNCREEAVPGGVKRYCPAHMANYKRKNAEYAAIRATLRSCTCCGEKLTKTGHDRGDLMCRDCTEKAEQQRRIDEEQAERSRKEIEKHDAFDRAVTLDDLKDWIKRYAWRG